MCSQTIQPLKSTVYLQYPKRGKGGTWVSSTQGTPGLHQHCTAGWSAVQLTEFCTCWPLCWYRQTSVTSLLNTQAQANCSQIQPCDSLCQTSHLFPQEEEGRVAMETPQGKGRAWHTFRQQSQVKPTQVAGGPPSTQHQRNPDLGVRLHLVLLFIVYSPCSEHSVFQSAITH